jgi:hypothetical protein
LTKYYKNPTMRKVWSDGICFISTTREAWHHCVR